MNIIFQISGGIGKSVMATAVCEAIKKKYPDSKLIVVTSYPDVFLNNPFVDRSYSFNEHPYFYSDYIENEDFKVFAHDPYLETSYIEQNEHLIKTWCEMFDLPYDGESPKINLTQREIEFFTKKYNSDKPIMLLQTNGGGEQNIKYSWARDIPSSIVERIIEKYSIGYNILHVRRDDQPAYSNTIHVSDSFRGLAVLIYISEKRLLIDSFAQHVAAGFGLTSTVLWIANKPEVFGYPVHKNIVANKFTKKLELKLSYLSKFNIAGEPIEFPYNSEKEIFNVSDITDSLSGKSLQ
jgi:hypothetical protein